MSNQQTAVTSAFEDGVARIHLDDGKANALSHTVLDALLSAFDEAEKQEARAVVLVGRPGRFSAGFDLSVVRQGPKQASDLVLKGADLAIRFYSFPAPIVLGVTGHALAMGAILCLSADERIGAEGDFKVGLNEVAIAMTLPDFGILLAQERLSRRHLQRAVNQAEIYAPQGAVDAGYLDRVVAPEAVADAALARARELAEGLHPQAHRNTKLALRAGALEQLRESVARDRA
ncbi:MAG: crotonase/enoyl-CoA hydratase family protein, partial [Myxococcota bacterium]|nr:crotonase/enoyl-CoA hydratase family protein [Myxococcota bacterium]